MDRSPLSHRLLQLLAVLLVTLYTLNLRMVDRLPVQPLVQRLLAMRCSKICELPLPKKTARTNQINQLCARFGNPEVNIGGRNVLLPLMRSPRDGTPIDASSRLDVIKSSKPLATTDHMDLRSTRPAVPNEARWRACRLVC